MRASCWPTGGGKGDFGAVDEEIAGLFIFVGLFPGFPTAERKTLGVCDDGASAPRDQRMQRDKPYCAF